MAAFGSFVAGQVLTAAELNAAGTWQDYTPSWTQSATITKTVNFARYTQFNKLVVVQVKMTATSAGTANNKILVGLPVNASSNNFLMGRLLVSDASSTNPYSQFGSVDALYETSSTLSFLPNLITSSGNIGLENAANSATPRWGQNYTDFAGSARTGFTIASGDVVFLQLTYEAA